MFWVIAGLATLLTLVVVFAPMLLGVGAGARRASYDLQVYRDQLREIDRDVARGVITEAEAAGTRVEISRKLLAAADAEAREPAARGAPRRVSLAGGSLAAAGALAVVAWAYLGQGAPGYPDQPLAERLARQAEARANRPGQAQAEAIVAEQRAERGAEATDAEPRARAEDVALVAELEALLEERQDDVEGHRLLARSLASLGEFARAHQAQERVVALLGPDAGAEDYVAWAEFMIAAANGYVSPEAERALGAALSRDPAHTAGRYYSGLTLLQGGRPDLAYRLWMGLIEEGPPDAPWVQAIEAEIAEVARMAGLPPPGEVPAATPPMLGGLPLVEDAEERATIEGMVASLGQRLAAEGGPAEDWARLIRSLGVLGRIAEAAAIWSEAQEVFAGDPAALALLGEAAREARLVQ